MTKTANRPPTNPEDRLDWSRIFPVFVIVMVDLLGISILIPLLPLYAASFGANALVIGLLSGAYPVMQFLFAPVLGRLSDRFGRKPVLFVSQIGSFLGFVLMGFANSLPLLLLARVIDGISGANISTAQAVITDSTNERNRTQALGLIGAAFGIGFTIGPVIAYIALALSGNNYHVVAFAAAGFSLLSILLTTFWLKESLPKDKRGQAHASLVSAGALARALGRPQIGFLLALMFMQQFVFGGLEYLLSLFTLGRLGMNASGNAVLFVFIGLIAVVVLGGLLGRWSRAHGDRWIIRLGLATLAAGMILIALTPRQPAPGYSRAAMAAELQQSGSRAASATEQAKLDIELPPDENTGWLGVAWIFLAIIPASIGGSILGPTINSAITKRADPAEVGGVLGLSASMSSGANALTPIIGGAMFQFFGSAVPFLLGGLILAGLWLVVTRQVQAAPQPTVQPTSPA